MDNKYIEATPQRLGDAWVINAPLVNIDKGACIDQIRKEEKWRKGNRNAMTVFKSAIMRFVLIALHKYAEMKKHIAAGNISIRVIEGEILIKTATQTIILGKGQTLALHEAIPHRVMATSETLFLLTLTTD